MIEGRGKGISSEETYLVDERGPLRVVSGQGAGEEQGADIDDSITVRAQFRSNTQYKSRETSTHS